ncbi:hypothetical protein GCM10009785_03690 [Brooklawnia cerclae]|uniref:DUF2157 domain-containing protein n=1 Tax=Brooklawnia cerclae TaxID=349934 RepID=A0ABX0SDS9_9ACTN|nr:hypothetical protein [Brooklawnia cerclae]NIH56039.1 hypothetical protein [Brooklawnia cerclae]
MTTEQSRTRARERHARPHVELAPTGLVRPLADHSVQPPSSPNLSPSALLVQTVEQPSAAPMRRIDPFDLVFPGMNSLGAVLALSAALVAVIAGPGAEITTGMFGSGAGLLSTGPEAFLIWWAVSAGLVAFLVWQWIPAHWASPRLILLTRPSVVAGLALLAWVILGREGHVVGAVTCLSMAIGALCVLVWRLARNPASTVLERFATDVGWGLLLGWSCVELLMSVGVVVDAFSLVEDDQALLVALGAFCVFIAGSLGLAGKLYRQYCVGLAVLWGFGWIGHERLLGLPRDYLLGGVAVFGVFIILAAFYASGRRVRHRVAGLGGRPPAS